MFLCTCDKIAAAYRSRITGIFFISGKVNGNVSLGQLAGLLQCFQACNDHYITSLHIVDALARGDTVAQKLVRVRCHIGLENSIEMSGQEYSLSLLSFS